MLLILCFFFFKQKTAYEMRISDWSSDVCSSDLDDGHPDHRRLWLGDWRHSSPIAFRADDLSLARSRSQIFHKSRSREHKHDNDQKPYEPHPDHHQSATTAHHLHAVGRSEEHTSELQSLMRNSYAVFCLKK